MVIEEKLLTRCAVDVTYGAHLEPYYNDRKNTIMIVKNIEISKRPLKKFRAKTLELVLFKLNKY